MKLNDKIQILTGVGDRTANLLANLDIKTLKDLLYHFPFRYLDTTNIENIEDIKDENYHTLQVEVIGTYTIRTRFGKTIFKVEIYDGQTKADCLFFNQGFLAKIIRYGQTLLIYGKIKKIGSKFQIIPSEYEILREDASSKYLGFITPIYPETAGLTSKWFRLRIKQLLDQQELLDQINDPLSPTILSKYHLIDRTTAIKQIHFPENFKSLQLAQSRLAFDEMYDLLRKIKKLKNKNLKLKARKIDILKVTQKINFEYELTASQKKVIAEILQDLSEDKPMNRLLQGDVGSGKTVVVVLSGLTVLENGFDVVLLAPTTVLANQHLLTISKMLKGTKYNIVNVTSKTKTTIAPLLGKPTLYVGTHALLYKENELFQKTALVIVDEQHKFGVDQRSKLLEQGFEFTPHFIMLTATPIPRTIAETLFATIDMSIIDSMPAKRQRVDTYIVTESKRKSGYKWIEERIKEGGQAYIVCPLIEESDASNFKNVLAEYEIIKKEFPKYKTGLLHGRLKEDEKNFVLKAFNENKIQLLVTTTVIEVGIDVSNANIMVIESAEKFGLAQLHQLRGRVGRGNRKSFCLLFNTLKETDELIPQTNDRLKFFATHTNGLELAEYDLSLRGPGEVYGTKQSGIPKFKLANIMDLRLIRTVKDAINF